MPETIIITPPRIGRPWPGQGGIYAGIIAGRDGAPDYHLIAAPAEHDLVDVAWGAYGKKIKGAGSYHDGRANTAAMVAAGLELAQRITAIEVDGHADFYLPSQAEIHLMAANLKEQMEPTWFWTSTQFSANYAWLQDFHDGIQFNGSKDYEGRARAVRRLVL